VHLHPLTRKELASEFDLAAVMERGLLPSMYFSDNPREDLQAYTGLYLQHEVVAEALTRNVPAFSRFLRAAALCNATIVNFTKVANDAQVPRTTVYEYFDILKDTLILNELPAWKASVKRKPLTSSKFYFFDVGVVAALQGRRYASGTPEYGEAFETYLMHELVSCRDYVSGESLGFWRSASGYEVDFIIGDHTAIEVKAKENVSSQELKSLRAISEEKKFKRLICVSLERRARIVDGIRILPYGEFLDELWSGMIT
jgi:predicted AAA+ superfamily ATPase